MIGSAVTEPDLGQDGKEGAARSVTVSLADVGAGAGVESA